MWQKESSPKPIVLGSPGRQDRVCIVVPIEVHLSPKPRGSTGAILPPPRGNLAMSGGVFGCRSWERGRYWHLRLGMLLDKPQGTQHGPTPENNLSPMSTAQRLGTLP